MEEILPSEDSKMDRNRDACQVTFAAHVTCIVFEVMNGIYSSLHLLAYISSFTDGFRYVSAYYYAHHCAHHYAHQITILHPHVPTLQRGTNAIRLAMR
jgi:hypothetical protein